MVEQTNIPEPEEIEQAQEQQGLQLTDLQEALKVIDLASSRGAFKTAEMEYVGGVYNRIGAFLMHVAKTQGVEPNQGSKGE